MEDARFDSLSRAIGSRRTTVGALLGLAAGFIYLEGDAKKNRNKDKKKPNSRHNGRKPHRGGDIQADGKKKKRKKKKKPPLPPSPPPNTPPPTDGGKTCAAGTIVCGETCVNPQTDALNCGACGGRCGNGVACVGGRCVSSCPASQIRCGDLCVDPTSNEDHCGGCLQACTGDLTCLNSTCGCAGAGLTACGNACVDVQDDDDHCGACGVVCNDNQLCDGGECVSTACGVDELDCGNGVCAGGAHPCCSFLDCGGGNGDLTCDLDRRQCVCTQAHKGICKRFSDGSGLCDVCCGDGSHICIEDFVCDDNSVPGISFCNCPAGKTRCEGSQNAFKCQTDRGNRDARRCGGDCIDCTRTNPSSFCCNGLCQSPCEPNTVCPVQQVCSDCQPCPTGTRCCRSGTSALFGCTPLDEFGRCPGPPA